MNFLKILCFLCLCLVSCDSAPKDKPVQEKPVVKIGVIMPLSGPVASMGAAFRHAPQLALKHLPKDTRYEYKLVIEDDQLQPAKVAGIVNKLIHIDKVDALVSTWSYGGNVVGPMAEKFKIPHFSAAWDVNILKYGEFNFLYMLNPRDFLPKFFKIFQKKNIKTAVVIGSSESGSVFCMNEFVAQAPAYGVNVLEAFEVGAGFDFKTIALKIKNLNPEVLFLNLVSPELEVLLKNLKVLNFQGLITDMTGFDLMEDLSLIEGSWYISESMGDGELVREFKEFSKQEIVYGLGNFYDPIKIIAQIYEAAPTRPSSQEVANQIAKLSNFNSAFGKVEMKDRIIVYEPQYVKVINGQRINVKESEL